MPRVRTNPDFLNGVPELMILKLLSCRPMHGYELVRRIGEASAGRLEFGEGCIYPLLHRLEQDGALESRREDVGGRSRVVYRVSTAGRKRLHGSVARWHVVADAVQLVLQGGQGGMRGHAGVA
jgi:PadR family transcriptional regulator PadR